MERPFLSICIPTRNRAHYLREALEALLPQALEWGVEVCISDNLSQDTTPVVLDEMERRFPGSFFRIRQTEGLTIDRSMIAALLMARGEFIVPAGDDDIFRPGSLKQILDTLAANRPDLFVFQAWHTDADLRPTHRHLASRFEGFVLTSPKEALRELWDKLPISSFCMNAAAVTPESLNRFDGTAHAYAGGIWEYLFDQAKSGNEIRILFSQPIEIFIRRGVKSWARDSTFIFLVAIPRWFRLLGDRYDVSFILEMYLERYFKIFQVVEYRGLRALDRSLVDLATPYLPENYLKRIRFAFRLPPVIAKALVCWPISAVSSRAFQVFEKLTKPRKKVRVICVNNVITALWMSAYLSMRGNDEKISTVVIFSETDVDRNVRFERALLQLPSDDAKTKELIAGRWAVVHALEKKIFRGVSVFADYFGTIIEPIYEGYLEKIPFSLKGVLRERRRKKKNFAKVRALMKDAAIMPRDVLEILYGNDGIHLYFAFLCRNARLLSFEHGLSDTLSSFVLGKSRSSVSSRLKNAIRNRLIYFDSFSQNRDETISALAPWISRENPAISTVALTTNSVRAAAGEMLKGEGVVIPSYLVGNCVLVLLLSVSVIGVDESGELEYTEDLLEYVQAELVRLGVKYDYLLVKGREEYLTPFDGLRKSGSGGAYQPQIIFFKDVFPQNSNAEVYLAALKPKAVVGSLSSCLFYAKAFDPNIRSLSYHRFFFRYTYEKYGKTLTEIEVLRDQIYGMDESSVAEFAPEQML